METLKSKAKELGLFNLWNIHESNITNVEYGIIAEITGWSPVIAPEACNCSAPDTGNMEVLMLFGNETQKHRYLEPLYRGDIRSCFAMTEPEVASSDPTNLQTIFRRETDAQGETYYRINGRKWWTTGAGHPQCRFAIVVGRVISGKNNTAGRQVPRHRQHTLLIVPMDAPGVRVIRPMQVFGYEDAPHGHCEIVFDQVCVPEENVIAGEGRGFEISQARLGPGRIHHCMRVMGITERALEQMCYRAKTRKAFHRFHSSRDTVRQQIGRARMDIESTRLLTLQAAEMMDRHGNAAGRYHISMVKVAVPNIAVRIIDEAMQLHGSGGFSQDFCLAPFYALVRSLRLADGPDEVHTEVIARHELMRNSRL